MTVVSLGSLWGGGVFKDVVLRWLQWGSCEGGGVLNWLLWSESGAGSTDVDLCVVMDVFVARTWLLAQRGCHYRVGVRGVFHLRGCRGSVGRSFAPASFVSCKPFTSDQ